jgi:putative membrane protein
MLTLGSILALAAAALHVVIFRLESLAWGGPQAPTVFGHQSPAEVEATRALAFNQGFYNLFLAVLAGLGAVLVLAGAVTVGATLLLAGTGSMLAAASVLLLSSRAHRAAAVKQGTLPLLAVLTTALGLLL